MRHTAGRAAAMPPMRDPGPRATAVHGARFRRPAAAASAVLGAGSFRSATASTAAWAQDLPPPPPAGQGPVVPQSSATRVGAGPIGSAVPAACLGAGSFRSAAALAVRLGAGPLGSAALAVCLGPGFRLRSHRRPGPGSSTPSLPRVGADDRSTPQPPPSAWSRILLFRSSPRRPPGGRTPRLRSSPRRPAGSKIPLTGSSTRTPCGPNLPAGHQLPSHDAADRQPPQHGPSDWQQPTRQPTQQTWEQAPPQPAWQEPQPGNWAPPPQPEWERGERPEKGRRTWLVVASVLVVMIAAGIAWFVARDDGPSLVTGVEAAATSGAGVRGRTVPGGRRPLEERLSREREAG